jgi:hypothetical protein
LQEILRLHTNSSEHVGLQYDTNREIRLLEVLQKHSLRFTDLEISKLRMFALRYTKKPPAERWRLLLNWWDVSERHLSVGASRHETGQWLDLAQPGQERYYHQLANNDPALAYELFQADTEAPLNEWSFYSYLRWLYLSSTEFKDFAMQWPALVGEIE